MFNADPNIGGRYSALSAFGLVPSGLAGADIRELLSEADAVTVELAQDGAANPGLVLGAVLAGTEPLRDKIAIVADGTHIIGFPDWAEQLIAESTGKQGRGLLPVVIGTDAPEVSLGLHDVQIVRLVANAAETREVAPGEVEISGSLGGQIMVWEYAVAVAGRLLDINPFDQPDVESAKIATRALLDDRPAPTPRPSRPRASRCVRSAASSSEIRSRAPCRLCCPLSRTTATCRSRRTSTGWPTPSSRLSATLSRRGRSVR
nr:hypothetical protein GCM10025699_53460 [Microbacterium flavescens]